MNIQTIKQNGAPEYAIIPFDKWEKMVSLIEELEDIRDARNISAAIADGEETFPDAFVKRLSSGENRCIVWNWHAEVPIIQFEKRFRKVMPDNVAGKNNKRTRSQVLLNAFDCQSKQRIVGILAP